eukprot:646767-Amphidinium_carterae.1
MLKVSNLVDLTLKVRETQLFGRHCDNKTEHGRTKRAQIDLSLIDTPAPMAMRRCLLRGQVEYPSSADVGNSQCNLRSESD